MHKNNTSWDNVADWYSDLLESNDDTYQAKVIGPNLTRIVGKGKGKKLLDVACGTGYFSRMFDICGFSVYGVDIGKTLIDEAKRLSRSEIEYKVAGADRLPYTELMFDVVSLVLAIQNIENVKGVFEEMRRVMKPNGTLLLVLNHPSFRIPKLSSWGKDEATQRIYRRVDAYLSESKSDIDMHPGTKNNHVTTISFHRPLQYYSKLLANAGFVIKRIEEWESHKTSGQGNAAKEENRIRKEIPMFLFIEVAKS